MNKLEIIGVSLGVVLVLILVISLLVSLKINGDYIGIDADGMPITPPSELTITDGRYINYEIQIGDAWFAALPYMTTGMYKKHTDQYLGNDFSVHWDGTISVGDLNYAKVEVPTTNAKIEIKKQ